MLARELGLRASMLVALLAGLGLLVAGCGGGSSTPPQAAGSAPLSERQQVSEDVTYAACLNKHGVQVQVARTGGLVWEAGPGIAGLGSPQATVAEQACKSLLPTGGLDHVPTPAQTAQNMALMLRYSRCIRKHGVPNFPDPTSRGLRLGPGADLNSPAFRGAEKSCRKLSLTISGS